MTIKEGPRNPHTRTAKEAHSRRKQDPKENTEPFYTTRRTAGKWPILKREGEAGKRSGNSGI